MENKKIPMSELFPFMQEVMQREGKVVFEPTGTSMLPMLRQGKDRVVLGKADRVLNKREIPLYQRQDGSFVLHRIVGRQDGRYIMCGDNQWIKEYGIAPEQILAVTVGFYRGEKYVSGDSKGYRLYAAIWTAILPMRKGLLRLMHGAGRLRRKWIGKGKK